MAVENVGRVFGQPSDRKVMRGHALFLQAPHRAAVRMLSQRLVSTGPRGVFHIRAQRVDSMLGLMLRWARSGVRIVPSKGSGP